MTGPSRPEIAVVVPSHDRALRLRWLLNALEEQTLDRERWEVIVGHDSSGPATAELLRTHPLATAGVLRSVELPPGSAPPGANRNAAWRLTGAPVIVFTDDDCRPPPEWLENALAAAKRHPGAVIQGKTQPDPHEEQHMSFPYARSQVIDPPGPYAQACNIIYPRELLERIGGFDDRLQTGEDADLALRAQASGAEYVGAPEMLTHHAVAIPTLFGRLRSLGRWSDLPALVKRHPAHRSEYPLRIFWKPTHPWFPLLLAALALSKRDPRFAVLAFPWVVYATPHIGWGPRARLRALSRLPGYAVVELAEYAVLARGNIRHRTLFL